MNIDTIHCSSSQVSQAIHQPTEHFKISRNHTHAECPRHAGWGAHSWKMGWGGVSSRLHSQEQWRTWETAALPIFPASQYSRQNRGGTFGVGGKLRSGLGELAGFPLLFFASQSSVGLPGSPVRKGWLPSTSSSAECSGRVGVRSWAGTDGGRGMGMGGGVRCTQGEDEALTWPEDGRTGGAGTLEGGLGGGGWGITGKAERVLGG